MIGQEKLDIYCGGASSLRGEVLKVETGVLHLRDDDGKNCYVAVDKIVVVWEARTMIIGRGLCRRRILSKPQRSSSSIRAMVAANLSLCCHLTMDLVSYLQWERHAAKAVDALQPILTKLRIDNSLAARSMIETTLVSNHADVC